MLTVKITGDARTICLFVFFVAVVSHYFLSTNKDDLCDNLFSSELLHTVLHPQKELED